MMVVVGRGGGAGSVPSRVSDSCVGWGWRGLGKDIMGFWVFDSDSGGTGYMLYGYDDARKTR